MEFRGLRKTIILSFLTFCCLGHHLCGDIEKTNNDTNPIIVEDQVHVGVILDMGSREGNIFLSCISMALSDFYYLHNNYRTRVVLHSKDSKGKPMPALSAGEPYILSDNFALDFIENIKVEAIIGAQTSVEVKLLAELGEAAKLPVMSLSSPLTDNKYPFFVEIMHADQAAEVKGIGALIEVFKWRDVILLYDNKEYERDFIPSLVNSFQEITHGSVSCRRSIIASSSSNEEIIEDLQMLMNLKINVFVVHVSHFLVPRLFLSANKLGMMNKEYAWIITSTSMNFFHSLDLSVIESMQGVLGFRSSIPASMSVHNLTSRLRRKFYLEDPTMEAIRELSVHEICAYDATWALAEAVERARLRNSTTRFSKGVVLLEEILQSRFKGLSGEIQYLNGKLILSETFEIVNVIGKGEIKSIGSWPSKEGKTRKESPQQEIIHNRRKLASTIDLEGIIWPGGSKRKFSTNETVKLRIGVPVRYGFKELVRVDHNLETNTTHVTGFSIEVFKATVEALPYEVQYEFIPFEDANGNYCTNYDDLVRQVYLKKFDAVVGDVTITWNRSQYVDFTVPYTDFGVGMLVPKNIDKGNMWIFFKPLSRNLWITTAAFFILTGIVVWVVEHPINTEYQGTPGNQIGTVLWFSFSTLVFANTEKLSNNLAKFAVAIWMFVMLILTSSYTATLASMITVKQIQLNSRGNYIGYQASSFGGVTVNYLNFSEVRAYLSDEEYFLALSKGSKHGGVSGIIDEIPYIKIFLAKHSADYAMIKTISITNGFGFAFPKGSKLVLDVSRQIERLRQAGKLIEMEKTWFHEKTTPMSDDGISNSDPNAIDLYDFRGLFLISGASLAIVLFLFVLLSLRFRNLIRGLMQRLRMFLPYGSRNMQPVPMQLVVHAVH